MTDGDAINDDPFFVRFSHATAIPSTFGGAATSVNQLPFYGDSWIRPDQTSARQYGNVIQTWGKGLFHLRHFNRANGWFLDGHVEPFDANYADNELNYQYVLGQNMLQITF